MQAVFIAAAALWICGAAIVLAPLLGPAARQAAHAALAAVAAIGAAVRRCRTSPSSDPASKEPD